MDGNTRIIISKDFEENQIYRILEYYDYSLIEPKTGLYNYCVIFFSGFNENSAKYLYLFKNFFEIFSKKYNIYFKIYLPMLDIYSRDDFPNSYMVNYDDDRQQKLYSWFNYIVHENKRVDFVTKINKDEVIKDIIHKEKVIIGGTEKFIFMGFSMGGRYLIYVLEKYNLKTKFNIIFKSPIFMYKSKKSEQNTDQMNSTETDKYFENSFFLIYSKNDKFCVLQDGLKSYFLLKNEFKSVKLKIDNGFKHIVDFNCLELLKETLVKELGLNQKNKF